MKPRIINVSLFPEQRTLLQAIAAQLRVSESTVVDALLVLTAALPPAERLALPGRAPNGCEGLIVRALGSGAAALVLLVPDHFPSPGAAVRWALTEHVDKLHEYLTQIAEAHALRTDIIQAAQAYLARPKPVAVPCPTCGQATHAK